MRFGRTTCPPRGVAPPTRLQPQQKRHGGSQCRRQPAQCPHQSGRSFAGVCFTHSGLQGFDGFARSLSFRFQFEQTLFKRSNSTRSAKIRLLQSTSGRRCTCRQRTCRVGCGRDAPPIGRRCGIGGRRCRGCHRRRCKVELQARCRGRCRWSFGQCRGSLHSRLGRCASFRNRSGRDVATLRSGCGVRVGRSG